MVLNVKARMPIATSGEGGLTIKREFYVDTDDNADTALTVMQSGLVPVYNDEDPDDSDYRCESSEPTYLGPRGQAGGHRFTVVATYRRKPIIWFANPADWYSIEGGGVDTTEDVFYDIDGNALQNSAAEFFDPPPQRESGDAAFTITTRQLDNPAATARAYSHTINNAAWYGQDAYSGKIGRIAFRQTVAEGVPLWEITWPLVFRPDGWRLTLVDAGYNTKSGSTLSPILIKGREPVVPQLLNGSGALLTPGSTPVTATAKLYRETNWGTLSLPNPFA